MDIKELHQLFYAGDTFYGYTAKNCEPNKEWETCDKCAFKGHFNCTLVICKRYADSPEKIEVVNSVYFVKE
jgi:hypothetical protein